MINNPIRKNKKNLSPSEDEESESVTLRVIIIYWLPTELLFAINRRLKSPVVLVEAKNLEEDEVAVENILLILISPFVNTKLVPSLYWDYSFMIWILQFGFAFP